MDDESEMDLLRQEVYDSMVKVREYHAGNTALMEALMSLLAGRAGAAVQAQAVLAECGMWRESIGLDWNALEVRRDDRMTWEQAVRKFVKQPAEVDRLLAMDRDE